MNYRIIDTSHGPVLLYRDQDENGDPTVIFRIDTPDNTMSAMHVGLGKLTIEGVQHLISSFPQEKAETLATTIVNLLVE